MELAISLDVELKSLENESFLLETIAVDVKSGPPDNVEILSFKEIEESEGLKLFEGKGRDGMNDTDVDMTEEEVNLLAAKDVTDAAFWRVLLAFSLELIGEAEV